MSTDLLRRHFLTGVGGGGALLAQDAQSAVDVVAFGAVGDGIADDTDAFEAAMRSLPKGGLLRLPARRFALRSLVLRDGIYVAGEGQGGTTLVALPSDEAGFVQMAEGPVRYAGLRDLTLEGSPRSPKQWAVNLVPRPQPNRKPHCGFWWGGFRDVSISQFGRGLRLAGGEGDYMRPHQFLTFRNLIVVLAAEGEGPSLEMSGQVNQGAFEQCHFDAVRRIKGAQIVIRSAGPNMNSPKLHQFSVVTVQNSDLGIFIENSHNISILRSWFESLGKAIQISGESFGIEVIGNRFANAGESGGVVTVAPGASGIMENNVFAGPKSKGGAEVLEAKGFMVRDNTRIWGAM